MKRSQLLFWFLCSVSALQAQLYVPVDSVSRERREKESEFYQMYSKSFLESLKDEYQRSDRSSFKKKYKIKDKLFAENIVKGDFLFDSRFNEYLDSIVEKIAKDNPQIPTGLKFYLARTPSLNATSMGNKCFILNMGSFAYLESESQLVSLIAHEIGHFMLRHSLKNIQHLDELKKSDELDDEIYKIRADKNGRGTKASDLLKKIMYQEGKLDKIQELEADSLGYLVFKNTSYPASDYLSALKLIAEYDTLNPTGLLKTTYNTYFNLPQMPFKESWLKMEDFSGYDYSQYKEKYNKDSISSHPETTERIAYLARIFPELKTNTVPSAGSAYYLSFMKKARYEVIASFNYEEEYGVGLYFCLNGLQHFDKDAYYKQWMGRFLRKIYEARKAYTLNRYLERVHPKQSISYQQFLNFMWNLNLSELKAFAEYYDPKVN